MPVGIAHSYRRKCPACVIDEIRASIDDVDEQERTRAESLRRWRAFAETRADAVVIVGDDDERGENSVGREDVEEEEDGENAEEGAEEAAEEGDADDEDGEYVEDEEAVEDSDADRGTPIEAVADQDEEDTDEEDDVENDEGGILTPGERQLLEQTRRTIRELDRRRRMVVHERQTAALNAQEDDDNAMSASDEERSLILDAARVAVAELDQRDLAARTRVLARRTEINGMGNLPLGPRVRARQAQVGGVDIMEQARQAEQRIWAQDGGGRLTAQQRMLVFSAQPLLATVPEEIRARVPREFGVTRRDRDFRRPRARNVTRSETPAEESMVETLITDEVAPAEVAATTTNREGLSLSFPMPPRRTVRDRPRIRLVRSDDEDSLRLRDWQLFWTTDPDHTPTFTGADMTNAGDQSEVEQRDLFPHEAVVPRIPSPAEPVNADDLYEIPIGKRPEDNREEWETDPKFIDEKAKNPMMQKHLVGPADCPCHEECKDKGVTSEPTHDQINQHNETLPRQRDSPAHRSIRLPQQIQQEELSEKTREVAVEFLGCGHQIATFVEHLEYVDAAHITAQCGCYGFDRCLVAHRKAVSRQICLVCRMERHRRNWVTQNEGRDGKDRCPWFEKSARRIKSKREWMLWPIEARSSGR